MPKVEWVRDPTGSLQFIWNIICLHIFQRLTISFLQCIYSLKIGKVQCCIFQEYTQLMRSYVCMFLLLGLPLLINNGDNVGNGVANENGWATSFHFNADVPSIQTDILAIFTHKRTRTQSMHTLSKQQNAVRACQVTLGHALLTFMCVCPSMSTHMCRCICSCAKMTKVCELVHEMQLRMHF